MNVAAILTATSVLFTAMVTGFIAIRREIKSVHKIVNQQRTDMMDEIKALKRMIVAGGGNPEDA